MFVSDNQFYFFILSVSIGFVLSPLFSVSDLFKSKLKRLWIRTIFDVIFFALFGVFYCRLFFVYGFPNLRPYMIMGAIVGIVLYKKSFHFILAKIIEKAYNITIKIKMRINERRKLKNDGRKG